MSEKNHVVEFIQDPVKCQMNFADRGSEELRRASQRLQRRQKSRWKGWINNDKYPNMVKCITYPTTETFEFYEYMSRRPDPRKSFESQ